MIRIKWAIIPTISDLQTENDKNSNVHRLQYIKMRQNVCTIQFWQFRHLFPTLTLLSCTYNSPKLLSSFTRLNLPKSKLNLTQLVNRRRGTWPQSRKLIGSKGTMGLLLLLSNQIKLCHWLKTQICLNYVNRWNRIKLVSDRFKPVERSKSFCRPI